MKKAGSRYSYLW